MSLHRLCCYTIACAVCIASDSLTDAVEAINRKNHLFANNVLVDDEQAEYRHDGRVFGSLLDISYASVRLMPC